MFGLDAAVINAMRAVFAKHTFITQVKIFGSRAKGTYRPNSDIDVALFGTMRWEDVASIRQSLDDLSTPYQFDVVAYALIEHPSLKDHVDRCGIAF